MKAKEGRDIIVGGDLAARAIKAGLVEVSHLFVTPTWWEVADHPSPMTTA